MNIVRIAILIAVILTQVAQAETFYLVKPYSQITDEGVKGYPVNTLVEVNDKIITINGQKVNVPLASLSKTPLTYKKPITYSVPPKVIVSNNKQLSFTL